MALIEWEDKYSVGVEAFDNQHKQLIKLINELYDAMKAGAAKEISSKIIEELVAYTVIHFQSEEKVFDEHDYEGTEEHKKEHQQFIDQVASFQKDFETGKVSLSIDIMNFLKDWLFSHILGTDQKYTSYLNSKGIK